MLINIWLTRAESWRSHLVKCAASMDGTRYITSPDARAPGQSYVPAVAACLTNALDDTGVLWFQVDARREL